jgi:hypothetical protein
MASVRAPPMSAASERDLPIVITHVTSGMLMHMTAATAGVLLLTFMPFLVSLAGRVTQPKVLCFVCSLMALLLSIEPCRAALPWGLGMAIAVIAVRERFRSA